MIRHIVVGVFYFLVVQLLVVGSAYTIGFLCQLFNTRSTIAFLFILTVVAEIGRTLSNALFDYLYPWKPRHV